MVYLQRWHGWCHMKLQPFLMMIIMMIAFIVCSRADSLRSHVILHERLAFYSAFLNIHRSGVLTALAWLVPHETAAISARCVYTVQSCTIVS